MDAAAVSKKKKKAFLRVYGTKRLEYGLYEIHPRNDYSEEPYPYWT
jgi:hypothetical protein